MFDDRGFAIGWVEVRGDCEDKSNWSVGLLGTSVILDNDKSVAAEQS